MRRRHALAFADLAFAALTVACAARPPADTSHTPLATCPDSRAELEGRACEVGLVCELDRIRCACRRAAPECGNEACEQRRFERAERERRGELPEPDGTFACLDVRCPTAAPADGAPCEPLATACTVDGARIRCVDGAWRVEPSERPR
ncbi:MAG TPA: hypothetical protein RMH99_32840 [Sandaracinaceae bacterium LLY-WYZ-13_1]|nr:hypothetical protein [Sandaracinaceae bacterium LLY-WYZ-13_1]